jgi:hypothetical protein
MEHQSSKIVRLEDSGEARHLEAPTDDNLQFDLQGIQSVHDRCGISSRPEQLLGILQAIARGLVEIGSGGTEFR